MSGSSHPVNCPCKYVPLNVSSFTLATYGLLSHGNSSKVRLQESPCGTFTHLLVDSSGLTCLHYSSQHNHADDVQLLVGILRTANADRRESAAAFATALAYSDPTLAKGCTPLHRACYSGALSSVSILLSALQSSLSPPSPPPFSSPLAALLRAVLLSRDMSTGDGRTCLAKAAFSGRPHAASAVLRFAATVLGSEGDRSFLQQLLQLPPPPGASTEGEASEPISPLVSVAQGAQTDASACSTYDRRSRWDEVAGGPPDWSLTTQLLLSYSSYASISTFPLPPPSSTLPSSDPLPVASTQQSSSSTLSPPSCPPGCECPADVLSSWTAAFSAAIRPPPSPALSTPPSPPLPASLDARKDVASLGAAPKAREAQCGDCGKSAFILKLHFDEEKKEYGRLCAVCFNSKTRV